MKILTLAIVVALIMPAGAQTVRITTADQFHAAIKDLRDGAVLEIAAPIRLHYKVGINPDRVTLRGVTPDAALSIPGGDQLLMIRGNGIVIENLTLRDVGTNLVKLDADQGDGVIGFTVRNCVFAGFDERAIKSTSGVCRDVLIEDCLFMLEHPKRRWDRFDGNYVGGLDLMTVEGLIVRRCIFRGIRGKSRESRGAVQVWQGSRDVLFEDIVITDCDAGLRLGVPGSKPKNHPYHVKDAVLRRVVIDGAQEEGVTLQSVRGVEVESVTVSLIRPRYGGDRRWREVDDVEGVNIRSLVLLPEKSAKPTMADPAEQAEAATVKAMEQAEAAAKAAKEAGRGAVDAAAESGAKPVAGDGAKPAAREGARPAAAVEAGPEVVEAAPAVVNAAPASGERVAPGITLTNTRREKLLYVDNVTIREHVQQVPGSNERYAFWLATTSDLPHRATGLALHSWGGHRIADIDPESKKAFGVVWLVNVKTSNIVMPAHSPLAKPGTGYDFWTGKKLADGKVHPVTQERALAALDYAVARQQADPSRTFVYGGSMGGSGAISMAIRYPQRFAWVGSGVGVAIPAQSPTFKSTYESAWGKLEDNTPFVNGRSVWEEYDAARRVLEDPARDLPYMVLSWGTNDNAIGWPQALTFLEALRDARHGFAVRWSSTLGHGTRTMYPVGGEREQRLDLRTDRSFPALNNCSLDQDPSRDPDGEIGFKVIWSTSDIEDTPDRWAVTLLPNGHNRPCTVDVTPRRCQAFRAKPGERFTWNAAGESGEVVADRFGLVTVKQVTVLPTGTRVIISR